MDQPDLEVAKALVEISEKIAARASIVAFEGKQSMPEKESN
jgi:hypothetical protein